MSHKFFFLYFAYIISFVGVASLSYLWDYSRGGLFGISGFFRLPVFLPHLSPSGGKMRIKLVVKVYGTLS